jgi:beta-glucanase (GH16 family)
LRRILITIAAVGALLAVPAVAAQAHPSPPKPTLAWSAPAAKATVTGTVDLAFTGSRLAKVTVYSGAKVVARAEVASDGTGASAELDSRLLRDGRAALVAVGTDSRGAKVVATRLVTVANRASSTAPAGYRLIFADEFGGSRLDRGAWCTRYMWEAVPYKPLQVPDDECLWTSADGHVFGNLDTLGGNGQEQEVYVDTNADGEKMHVVANGYLALRATKTGNAQYPYESAMIRAKKEFAPTPGHPLYLTARVRMPDVKGTWPAFWLASGLSDRRAPDWPPEIDILEAPLNGQGQNDDTIHVGTITYGSDQDPPPQGTQEWSDVAPGFDTQWGNYVDPDGSVRERWVEVGAEWSSDRICWFVDGEKTACQAYTWVTNDGFVPQASVLLNLAIGGPWAGSGGIEDAAFPTEFDVDHVRIYRR